MDVTERRGRATSGLISNNALLHRSLQVHSHHSASPTQAEVSVRWDIVYLRLILWGGLKSLQKGQKSFFLAALRLVSAEVISVNLVMTQFSLMKADLVVPPEHRFVWGRCRPHIDCSWIDRLQDRSGATRRRLRISRCFVQHRCQVRSWFCPILTHRKRWYRPSVCAAHVIRSPLWLHTLNFF